LSTEIASKVVEENPLVSADVVNDGLKFSWGICLRTGTAVKRIQVSEIRNEIRRQLGRSPHTVAHTKLPRGLKARGALPTRPCDTESVGLGNNQFGNTVYGLALYELNNPGPQN
jgi:hypothetical protein